MNADIVKLREMTGAGVMDAKRALEDSKGNFEKAVKLIQERGVAKAEKKADRATGAGLLEAYVHNGRVGVLLELRCETDFVARSEPFKALAKDLVMQIAAMGPGNPEMLLAQPYIKNESLSISQFISQTVAKVGENIKVAQFCRYEL